MDLRRLTYFVGVVEAGSFTKAASQLNVAQSALSLHIRQMEEGFGTELLIRHRTGVTPTVSGAKLIRHARAILRQVSLAEEELTCKAQSPCGEITIGISSGLARIMVPELLGLVSVQLPNVSIKIVEAMSSSIEEWLELGRVNIAVLEDPVKLKCSSLLASEELCLVVPPKHPGEGEAIRLSDLPKFSLALPTGAAVRKPFSDVTATLGRPLNISFEVDSLFVIIDLVSDGKACAILAPSCVQRETSRGYVRTVRITEPKITRSVVIAEKPREQWSIVADAVRSLIFEVAAKLTDERNWQALLPHKEAGLTCETAVAACRNRSWRDS